jgi:hypothetical protein
MTVNRMQDGRSIAQGSMERKTLISGSKSVVGTCGSPEHRVERVGGARERHRDNDFWLDIPLGRVAHERGPSVRSRDT